MKRVVAAIALAILPLAGGCNPYCVDVSLEGINWFMVHPACDCCSCPYANPHCPYFDYQACEWMNVPAAPTISALNSPPVVKKAEDEHY